MRLPFALNYFEICLFSIHKDQIWTAVSTIFNRIRMFMFDVDLDRDPDRQFLLLFTAMPVYNVFMAKVSWL
jgi:hypothetical protein